MVPALLGTCIKPEGLNHVQAQVSARPTHIRKTCPNVGKQAQDFIILW
jgi:hypothetical protein